MSIPGLATQYQPPKLCRTVEEAKIYAAEYTLQQLGVPLEGILYLISPQKMLKVVKFTFKSFHVTVQVENNNCYNSKILSLTEFRS